MKPLTREQIVALERKHVEGFLEVTDVPSLEGLAYALRHKEMWPPGFRWGYNDCRTCALGMVVRLWGVKDDDDEIDQAFGLNEEEGSVIFYEVGLAHKVGAHAVTPEMVADTIDAVIASKS